MDQPTPADPEPTAPQTSSGSAGSPVSPGSPSVTPASTAEVAHDASLPRLQLGSLMPMLLRGQATLAHYLRSGQQGIQLTAALLLIVLVCFAGYGLILGSFSGEEQLWAAPLKLTLGALFAALICLPSLYVFSCLSGAELDLRFGSLVGLLLATLALEGLLLVSFGPVAWIFSESTNSLLLIACLHLAFWMIAVFFALKLLYVGVHLWGSRDRHYLVLWMFIFLLVNLQMITAVRPLLGRADTLMPQEKKFFLAHWIDTIANEEQRLRNEWSQKHERRSPQTATAPSRLSEETPSARDDAP